MPKGEHLKGKGGVKFGSGQDPTKGGRKKKIYTVLKDKGYSKDDVITAFTEMLFYSLDELKEVAQDKTKPIIMGIVATALRDAYIQGDYKKGKDIIEQVIGRALQRQELTGKDGKDLVPEMNYDNLSLEEKLKLRELHNKAKND
jgi:hypothetical protein